MLRNNINYVYEVYKEKSFSKAAQKLYISQPALSSAVQKEEAYWGCTFFDRSSNPIELTLEGKYFIAAVERIKETQRDLEALLGEHMQERQKMLNIGAPAFFCSYTLPTLVKSFKESNPDCKVNIIEANDGDLLNCLSAGTIDVCLTVERWSKRIYKSIAIYEEDIILAVPSSFLVNKRLKKYQISSNHLIDGTRVSGDCPKVSVGEFRDIPFLLLKKGNDMYDRAMKLFQQEEISPEIFMTLDQLMTSYHMAIAGMGATFIRAGLMRHAPEDICFYSLDSPCMTRTVNLVYRKSRDLPRIMKEFIRFLSK